MSNAYLKTEVVDGQPVQVDALDRMMTDESKAAYRNIQRDYRQGHEGRSMDHQVAVIRSLLASGVIDTDRAKEIAYDLKNLRRRALARQLADTAASSPGAPELMGAKSTDWRDYYVPATPSDYRRGSLSWWFAEEASAVAARGDRERALFLAHDHDLVPGVAMVPAYRDRRAVLDTGVYPAGVAPEWALPADAQYSPVDNRWFDPDRDRREIAVRRRANTDARRKLSDRVMSRLGQWLLGRTRDDLERTMRRTELRSARDYAVPTHYLQYSPGAWLPRFVAESDDGYEPSYVREAARRWRRVTPPPYGDRKG